jgi:hypothetical protein
MVRFSRVFPNQIGRHFGYTPPLAGRNRHEDLEHHCRSSPVDAGHVPVQPLQATTSRADVLAGADAAARAGNLYGDVVPEPPTSRPSARDRASVRAEAVATAHAPNQNLDRRAFFNSEVPPQLGTGRQ